MIFNESHPLSGPGYLLQGIRLIARPGLRLFVLIPLLINLLLFSAAIYAGVRTFSHWTLALRETIPSWLTWLEWLLWPVFILILLVILFYGFGLVANLIAAPFNGLLAEKVERLLTGQAIDEGAGLGTVLTQLVPSLVEEIRKTVYAIVLAIPFLVLLLIPVIGAALWLLYVAWILAVQYADYPMANHGLKFREMRRRLAARPMLSLGFGGAAALLSMIPIVNFILMPSAVAGATLMWVRELKGSGPLQGSMQSRVASHCVLLIIDHLSGRMTGEVLAGVHRGKRLETLQTDELLALLDHCYARDPNAAEALEAYLEHERGVKTAPTPRRERGTRPETDQRTEEQMHAEEALSVLGLNAGADAEAVRNAHRRLIHRLHPDRGGTDYLAAKINEAKHVLLTSPQESTRARPGAQ